MGPRRSAPCALPPLLALPALLALAVGLGAAAGPAGGAVSIDADPPEVGASTDPTGAHVTLDRRGAWSELAEPSLTGTRGGRGRQSGCLRTWIPTDYPVALRPAAVDLHVVAGPPRPGPDYQAYLVLCGDRYLATVWLRPSQFTGGPGAVLLRAVAERLARDLPYPAAILGVSPERRGLTGLEAWWWVEGYGPAPLRHAVSGFGATVEVEARADRVVWDFGDGTAPVVGSLGRRYPARSDVTHTYEHRSTGAGFVVRVTVRIAVHYRVDGGEWIDLAPVSRSATRAYPVIEERGALVPTGPSGVGS